MSLALGNDLTKCTCTINYNVGVPLQDGGFVGRCERSQIK